MWEVEQQPSTGGTAGWGGLPGEGRAPGISQEKGGFDCK